MGRVVLDTGALIAWEAGTRTVRALIEEASGRGHDLFVPAGVLAQYWRGGSGSQVRVARLLKSCELDPLTPDLARSAGVLSVGQERRMSLTRVWQSLQRNQPQY